MKNALPFLLGAAAAALYMATAQRAFYDDGIRFEALLGGNDLAYIHVLYLPVVAGLRELLSFVGVDSEQALKITAALSGGFTVGVTCRIGLDTLIHPGKAAAVALLLAGLLGFWFHSTATELHAFHAAFASLLLLGLIRIIDAPERMTPGLFLLLFLGALTTPASHASGVATALPILCAFCYAKPARLRFSLAIGAGFAIWAAVYYYLYTGDGLFRGYSTAQSEKLPHLLANPGLLPGQFQAVAAELLLYSVPASTLIPAGFRVLRQKAPRHAMLCLAWIFSWAILALPVGDRAWGSNFIATLPAQALLAIVALHGLATSRPRMVLTAVLALLPAAVSLQPDAVGFLGERGILGIHLGSALLLFLMVRPAVARPRWPFLLHPVAFALSAVLMLPRIHYDPVRDYIGEVSAKVDADAMVVVLEMHANNYAHWGRYFPGAQNSDTRLLNPFVVEFLLPEEVDAQLDEFRGRVVKHVSKRRRLYLIQQKVRAAKPVRYPDPLAKFLAELGRDYAFRPTGVDRLFELKRRAP